MVRTFRVYFQSSVILTACVLGIYYCAKKPAAPIHSATSIAALAGSACNLGLAGTGTGTSTSTSVAIEPIVPIVPTKLTLKNLEVQGAKPFPSLSLVFLTLSAEVNDKKGGFTRFSIQSLSNNDTFVTENVPSGMTHWIHDLPAGTYKVSASPCNSLGCREDWEQVVRYQQQVNNYPDVQVSDTLKQCMDIQDKIRDAADSFVKQAKSAELQLEKHSLNLASSSDPCAKGTVDQVQTGMGNIDKLGEPYIRDLFENPDAMQIQEEALKLTADANSTGTTTNTETSTDKNSQWKTIALGLGSAAAVAGFFAFLYETVSTKGWTTYTTNRRLEVRNIANNIRTSYDPSLFKSLRFETDLKIPKSLIPALDLELNKPSDVVKSTDQSTKPYIYPEADRITYEKKVSSFYKSAGVGGIGALIAIAGGAAIVYSQLGLASSNDTLTGLGNFLATTVAPLQDQFGECTVTLSQKIEAAAQK